MTNKLLDVTKYTLKSTITCGITGGIIGLLSQKYLFPVELFETTDPYNDDNSWMQYMKVPLEFAKGGAKIGGIIGFGIRSLVLINGSRKRM